jgi:Na+-driven multidrug efflux pump
MSRRFDPLSGDVVPVFFHYAVPSVIGILAATSAGVIDGFFIGNFVGAAALAAVNIAMPAFYLFAAMVFMLAIGGSVMCGKRWKNGWDAIGRAAFNGFSEFANEISIGLVTLLFNWVMITRMGVPGVAAFTIVGYLLMVGIEVCYGFADSLNPTVSKNLGARDPDRIARFTRTAVLSALLIGLLSSSLLLAIPEAMISVFLAEGEAETEQIALAFIAVFWPAFLFNGANITLAAYFTAMHKPLQSAAIAVSRSLVLPGLGVLLLPIWLGDAGVFAAIPLAEGLTLLLAAGLFAAYRPSKLVARLVEREGDLTSPE